MKRNKRTGAGGGSVSNLLTKKLLKLFGFPHHQAPGEAEAECALLQREGIVDAVLSEDVDTLMFGSGLTLRNWSSEGTGNKSPTHVNAYYSKATKEGKSGLDREGMILVALMSGGDYNTEGIPGCGIKLACEAARAGYGKSLCQIPRSDVAAYEAWRNNLALEILTNESKQFKTKHKTLTIPEDFPDRVNLGYYTHPVVSKMEKINKMKEDIQWDGPVDIPGLRQFTAEAFEWTNKGGCKKFIRGIAPTLLVQKLRMRADRRESGYGDLLLTAINETEIVRSVCGNRKHFSMDGMPELRLMFVPIDIVGLNLDDEEDPRDDYGRDGLAPRNEDDKFEEYVSDDASRSASPTKRGPSMYDPTQPEKVWVSYTIAKVGIPLKVEDYEESLRKPKKATNAQPKAAPNKTAAKGGMPKGAMERFVKVSKPVVGDVAAPAPTKPTTLSPLPPVFLAPTVQRPTRSSTQRQSTDSQLAKTTTRSSRSRKKALEKPKPNTNPWTLAAESPSTQTRTPPRVTKTSPSQTAIGSSQIYILSSSPAAAQSPTQTSPPVPVTKSPILPPRKHAHSPSSSPLSSNPDLELPLTVHLARGSKSKSAASHPNPSTPTKSTKPPRKKISPDQPSRNASPSLSPELRLNVSPTRKEAVIVIEDSPLASQQSQALGLRFKGIDEEEVAVKETTKKVFMLRQSLPGGWKEVDEDEVEREEERMRRRGQKRGDGGRWRESQVEVLDLTEE